MNTKTLTAIVTGVAIAGLIGYDLFVNFNKVEGDTISEVAGHTFRAAPILAVALGVVAGHLCSDNPDTVELVKWVGQRPIFPLIYGLIGGFLFWNMGR